MKSDSEIRDDVIDELRWEPRISDPDAIGVAVRDGAVTLTGSVPSYAEKLAAAEAAQRVYGVKAVKEQIEESFKREAEIDARHIRVEVTDHTAQLYGHVHSLHEAEVAREAAASAPGIATVDSHLLVSP